MSDSAFVGTHLRRVFGCLAGFTGEFGFVCPEPVPRAVPTRSFPSLYSRASVILRLLVKPVTAGGPAKSFSDAKATTTESARIEQPRMR